MASVPPLRGRLGGGWYDCLKKSLTKHSNLPQVKEQVTLVKCHQPPPILPRRGGTDTLASNIIVSSRLIISDLSIVIVTVPPLRGRLGGGWFHQTCFHFLPLYLRFIMVYRSECLRGGDAQSPPSVGVRFPCRELSLVSGSRAASDKP